MKNIKVFVYKAVNRNVIISDISIFSLLLIYFVNPINED